MGVHVNKHTNMANNWNITIKDSGLIGGNAKGTQKELQLRLDKLNDFYTKAVNKIEREYKASFISARAKVKKSVTKKRTK